MYPYTIKPVRSSFADISSGVHRSSRGSTLIGQMENTGNFTQMMLKYYTKIISWRNKEMISPTIVYLSIICKPMNYNILLKLFSINMQIHNKKYIWHEFSDIFITKLS